MGIKLTKSSELKREYRFSMSKAEMLVEIEKIAADIAPRVKMDGFRNGKVPIDIIKSAKMPFLIERAISISFEKEMEQEIKEKKIKIETEPVILNTNTDLTNPQSVTLTVSFEVEPSIPEIDYSKFEVETPLLNMEEEEVYESLINIAKMYATMHDVEIEEYEIKNTDIAFINFEGFIDGVPFDGGKSDNYAVEVGTKSLIDTFDEQLLGHKKGDKFDVLVKFPSDYHVKEISGKEAVFKVEVVKIAIKKLPEMDESFAKKLKANSIEEVKEKIRESTAKQLNSLFFSAIGGKLLSILVEKNQFDIPEAILKEEVDARMELQKEDAKEQEGSKSIRPKSRKEVESDAKKALMQWYFINGYSKSNDIKTTEQELEKFIKSRLTPYGSKQNNAMHQFYMQNEKLKDSIKKSLHEEKVIASIIEKMTKITNHLSKKKFEEFIEEIKDNPDNVWKIRKKSFFG